MAKNILVNVNRCVGCWTCSLACMTGNGLKKIRNLGAKSEREIIRSFFTACYYKLNPAEQAVFWQKVIERSA